MECQESGSVGSGTAMIKANISTSADAIKIPPSNLNQIEGEVKKVVTVTETAANLIENALHHSDGTQNSLPPTNTVNNQMPSATGNAVNGHQDGKNNLLLSANNITVKNNVAIEVNQSDKGIINLHLLCKIIFLNIFNCFA